MSQIPHSELAPDWPSGIHVWLTDRSTPGYSQGGFGPFNPAKYIGDSHAAVETNRAALTRVAMLPREPAWLTQEHGACVYEAPFHEPIPRADASWTAMAAQPLVVVTADCLPVVLVSADSRRIGVAHAGWRGLSSGVIGNLAKAMQAQGGWAWLGPVIGAREFMVGADVHEAFCKENHQCEEAFSAKAQNQWQADLTALAVQVLQGQGVERIGMSGRATVADEQCFSFRRQGQECGRMATLVWRSLDIC